MRFIALIAAEEKKLLKMENCKIMSAPRRLKELSVKMIYDKFKDDRQLVQYLPPLKQNRLPPRDFFFILLASIKPESYKDLLSSWTK